MIKLNLHKILFILIICLLGMLLITSCTNEPKRASTNLKLNLIPFPKSIKGKVNKEGEYRALEYIATIKTEEKGWENAKNAFCEYAKDIHNVVFSDSKDAEIILIKDTSLTEGAYKITVGNKVKLYASEDNGINNSLSMLLQLMKKSDNGLFVPKVTVNDKPDSSYRGMMVDLARDWHEFEFLINYVDMCYYYKINVLHLHFTDSQSYTLPSELYPDLSTKDRHYTKQQINELVEYAYARGVELMPEIDVPGHCDSFQSAYRDIFGTGGIIHQHEASMDAMSNIFGELCDMFPYSKYIHIGGDEAAIDKWVTCRGCKNYIQSKGIDTAIKDKKLLSEQMLANFVSHLANAVFTKNKIPVVWEGFAKEVNDMVSKDIIVMSWENYYQPTEDLLAAGFRIINSSWVPLYIVTPDVHWSQEQVFNWDIYSWKPVHPQSPFPEGFTIKPNDKVLGGQILAWGDQIITKYKGNIRNGVMEEMKLLLERLPALSEKTWNVNSKLKYSVFTESYEKTRSDIVKLLLIK